MANGFNKEEKVAWEAICEGFTDGLVMTRNVSRYNMDPVMAERTGDIVWRPYPYVLPSYDGTDATANFKDVVQLSVPASIGYTKHVPWQLTATELRDQLQSGRLGDAAKQRLASDINTAVLETAAKYGSLVVKRTVAATGYDDVSLCDSIMNEQGVPQYDRVMALGSRDYNAMAGNLAARYTMTGKPTNAYERAFLGVVAGFDTFKSDVPYRLTAAAGGAGITIGTRDVDANYYTPAATSTATTGERNNVDNRFQTVTVSSTANVAAGDAFTIAALNAVHHITKTDTGQLKTFRVVSVTDGTHMVITPPIITAQGGTAAEAQYQNCVINTKAANSAIVFLNTTTAGVNVFWQRDAIELLPGSENPPEDAGAAIMRYTDEASGVQLVMQKQYDINTQKTKFRVDTRFGVCAKNTEMMGLILFGQS